MKNMKFEGVVGSYSFQMVDENVIEVWDDKDLDFPFSFIYLKEGDVKSEKDFHMEISSWFIRNVG